MVHQSLAYSLLSLAVLLLLLGQRTTTQAFAPLSTTGRTLSTAQRLTFTDVVIGDGDEVQAKDRVSVHYKGSFLDADDKEVVFEDSRVAKVNRGTIAAAVGQPIFFAVGTGQVIPGWDQGILGSNSDDADNSNIPPMRVGGKRTLVIEPDLAYGVEGRGAIPPNQELMFDVELVSIDVQQENWVNTALFSAIPAVGLILLFNSVYLTVTGQA